MTKIRIGLVLIFLGSIVIFTTQNLSPVMPLVFLGGQTLAFPLAFWLLLAIALGALTSGLIAIAGGGSGQPPRSRRGFYRPDPIRERAGSPRPTDQPRSDTWADPYVAPRDRPPVSTDPTDQPQSPRSAWMPFGRRSASPAATPTAAEAEDDDWGDLRQWENWDDWGQRDRPSPGDRRQATLDPPLPPPHRGREADRSRSRWYGDEPIRDDDTDLADDSYTSSDDPDGYEPDYDYNYDDDRSAADEVAGDRAPDFTDRPSAHPNEADPERVDPEFPVYDADYRILHAPTPTDPDQEFGSAEPESERYPRYPATDANNSDGDEPAIDYVAPRYRERRYDPNATTHPAGDRAADPETPPDPGTDADWENWDTFIQRHRDRPTNWSDE